MQQIIKYNSLPNEIKNVINEFITTFNYVDLTIEKIISMINGSDILKKLCNYQDGNWIEDFKKELFDIISAPIKDSIKIGDYNVIINYIENRLKKAKGIIEIIYELDCLNVFFATFEIDATPELITHLLKSSTLFAETIEKLYKRIEKHPNLKNQLSDFVTNLIEISLMAEMEIEIDDDDFDDKEIAKLAKEEDFYSEDFVRQLIVESHKYPLLSSEETVELVRKYRNGSKYAQEKLMLHNSRLVISIARKYYGHGLDMLDLIQEGNIGLAKGIEKFNPELGFRFSTYVSWWIKQAVSRSLADNGRNIRIPVHMQGELIRYRKVVDELKEELDRTPTIEEIAKKMGIPQNKALSLHNYNTESTTISIHTPVNDEENGSDLSTFIPAESSNFTEEILRNINSEEIRKILEKINLKPREREVLAIRYELDGEDKKTLEEIAKEYGVTRERIRQIEVKAIEKILLSPHAKKLCELAENPEEAWQRVLMFREIRAAKALQDKNQNVSRVNPIQILNDATTEETTKKEGEKMKILSLTELFNQTKEELAIIIAKLPEDDQAIIKKLYDEDYAPKKGVKRTPEENNRWYASIIKTIRKYIMDPNYMPVIKNKAFYHEIGISLEVFNETVLPLLTEEEKALIAKYYDSEYKRNKTSWNPDDKKEMKKMARKYQPKLEPLKPIDGSLVEAKKPVNKNRGEALYVLLMIEKTKLEEYVKRLSDEDQQLIRKYYDADYQRKDLPFTKEDRPKFYGSVYQKLIKMSKNPNYRLKNEARQPRKHPTKPTEVPQSKQILKPVSESNECNEKINMTPQGVAGNTLLEQPKELANQLGEITINIQNQQILNQLSPLVNIIVALRMHYSTEAIAKYLQIDEDVVRNILRQYLVSCKESLNMIFEDLINGVDEETIRLERKKDEI